MKKNRIWVRSFLHAFVLLALSLFWLHTPYTYGDESLLVKWSSIVKRVIFKFDQDPPKDDFLFINLGFEKALIPLEDKLGNETITDRAKLAEFFTILKNHPKTAKFIYCDVFLKGNSNDDGKLATSVHGIPNILFPSHLDLNGKPELLAIDVPFAIADYRSTDEDILKFNLIQGNGYKSVPVAMYETLNKGKVFQSSGLFWDKSQMCLNSIIVDYPIRTQEVFTEEGYPVVNLSELLLLPEDIIANQFLKNRIVVMGDFEQDVHNTIFGSMPGTLILLNVYLSLVAGYHQISIFWILFMLAAFTLYSRLLIFQESKTVEGNRWLNKLLENMIFLTTISVISYFLFNIGLQILVLTIYTSIVLFIIKVRRQKLPIFKPSYWLKAQYEKFMTP